MSARSDAFAQMAKAGPVGVDANGSPVPVEPVMCRCKPGDPPCVSMFHGAKLVWVGKPRRAW